MPIDAGAFTVAEINTGSALELLVQHAQTERPDLREHVSGLQPPSDFVEQGAYILLRSELQAPQELARICLTQTAELRDWMQALPPTLRPLLSAYLTRRMTTLLLGGGLTAKQSRQLFDTMSQWALREHLLLLRAQWAFRQQEFQTALNDLTEVLQHHTPQCWSAWRLKAQTLVALNRTQEALRDFLQLSQDHPERRDLRLVLGNLYQLNGNILQAAATYRELLRQVPDENALEQAGIWNNLGRLALQHNQPQTALRAFLQALNLAPELSEARLNAARLHLRFSQFQAAEALLRPVAECGLSKPLEAGQAELLWLYGRLLGLTHRPEQAELYLQRALNSNSGRYFWRLQEPLGFPESLFLHSAASQAQWARTSLKALNQGLQQGHNAKQRPFPLVRLRDELGLLPETLWGLHYLSLPAALQLELNQSWASAFELAPRPDRRWVKPQAPLRLGFLVTEGHEGIFKMQQGGIMMGLPAEAFVPVLIGKQAHLPGCEHPALERVELPDDLLQAAACVRDLELDMLYYWEVGSDVINYFLPFFRPAPLQFTSVGTPASTGHPGLDVYLCPTALSAQHFSERLWPMECMPGYYEQSAGRAVSRSREFFALPPNGPLLLCLQNPLKFSAAFLQELQDFLGRQKQQDAPVKHRAQLVLLKSRQPWVQARVEAQIQSWPETLQARVHWVSTPLPRGEYLALIQLAHVVLDTPDFNGYQSNLDALAMGKPVIHCNSNSERLRAQFTRGLLAQLGCPELSFPCFESYWDAVEHYLHDSRAHAEICHKIQRQQGRLFENPDAIEAVSRALWELACEYKLRAGPMPTSAEACG